jgi:toxin YoeB
VNTVFSDTGWEDYLHWQAADAKVLKRVNDLIKDCKGDPFKGVGKPEPLKGDLKDWWSRRVTEEDRLVYRVIGQGAAQAIEIAQCRYHY